MTGYIYLASPYTSKFDDGSFDEKKMEERYQAVLKVYAKLVANGLTVYCPIAMTHEIDKMNGRFSPSFWYHFDKPFLENARELYILKLPGWEKSEGIKNEMFTAVNLNIPTTYLNPHLYVKI